MVIKTRSSFIQGSSRCFSPFWDTVRVKASQSDLEVSTSAAPGGNNAFSSSHFLVEGSLLNNDGPIDAQSPGFNQCPSGFYNYLPGLMSVPAPSNADFTSLMAHTNPSNPNILIPTFLWELKDVPDMIRQGGRIADAIRRRKSWGHLIRDGSRPRDIAAANLAIQFGWAPFLSDMMQLATFQESVDKRKKMFEKLKSKGLRGRVPLGNWSEKTGASYNVWSPCGWVQYVSADIQRTVERWGSIRWIAQSGISLPSTDGELRRRMAGLTLDHIPLNVWEALPWSWLVDYFVNVGNLLKAGNRTIAYPSHACVMTRYVSISTHGHRRFDPYRVISPGKCRQWRHMRHPAPAAVSSSAAMPTLSAPQLSILGSLAILRTRTGRSL